MDPATIADETYDHFSKSYDHQHGGFGSAPKFPTPVQLLFLMDYYYYYKNDPKPEGEDHTTTISRSKQAESALEMATNTLRHIATGGIHDHIGSGFHRYSTDDHWHVPHFEKMLYDQAQLLTLYASAYQLTGDEFFLVVVKDIVLYVKRDMLPPDGGAFYSAEDADSHPSKGDTARLGMFLVSLIPFSLISFSGCVHTDVEGAFCVWEASEIDKLLDSDILELYKEHYGILERGNVDPDQDPHNELNNKV